MFPRRILAIIFFFYFLVLHQQANININLMICCLLLMQNLRAQNILVTRCIRRQRNRYRRRAPYYWTLPRPVESWFEIHYTDRTIPGDYFRRLLRIYPSWWILRILLPHFIRKVLVARAWIHVVAK